MNETVLLEWFNGYHTDPLKCAKGHILRRREWAEHGRAGCFTDACPNPGCAIPALVTERGKGMND